MTLFPKQYDVYDIADTFIQSVDGSFRGTGSDTSQRSYTIYFASAATERFVTFKAFIQSYKVNFQKQVDEKKFANIFEKFYTDKTSNLSIDLTFDVPSHSVNESVNNVAKLEELQKLILIGQWSDGVNVSKVTNIHVPIMLVHFRNLISNGRKDTSFAINSFNDILKKGFPCTIDSVNFEPDVDAGFFEFKNFIYPKNLKVQLKLDYDSEYLKNEFNELMKQVTIDGIDSSGNYRYKNNYEYAETAGSGVLLNPSDLNLTGMKIKSTTKMDSGLFPFHSYQFTKEGKKNNMFVSNMNDPILDPRIEKKRDSFLFISLDLGQGIKEIPEGWVTDYEVDTHSIKGKKIFRHVFLDLFLDSFSRNLTVVNTKSEANPNSSVFSKITSQDGRELSYSMKLNLPADSLIQAKQNCAKIQVMSRMFIKRNNSEVTAGQEEPTILSNEVMVYSPSFIEAAGATISETRNIKTIYKQNCIRLLWSNFSFDVNMEAGFFVEGEMIFPKVISVDLGFKTTTSFIEGYNLIGKNEWETAATEENSAREVDNAELFPYNRQTIRL